MTLMLNGPWRNCLPSPLQRRKCSIKYRIPLQNGGRIFSDPSAIIVLSCTFPSNSSFLMISLTNERKASLNIFRWMNCDGVTKDVVLKSFHITHPACAEPTRLHKVQS